MTWRITNIEMNFLQALKCFENIKENAKFTSYKSIFNP